MVLQAVVNCLRQILESELKSSGKTVSILNPEAIYPAPVLLNLALVDLFFYHIPFKWSWRLQSQHRRVGKVACPCHCTFLISAFIGPKLCISHKKDICLWNVDAPFNFMSYKSTLCCVVKIILLYLSNSIYILQWFFSGRFTISTITSHVDFLR